MSTNARPGGAPSPGPRAGRALRDLRVAWVSLALLPVAFVLATLLGEWLLALQGYQSGTEQPVPVAAALLAGVPALLVLVAPAATAAAYGWRAGGRGRWSGRTAAIVGVVATLGLLILNVAAFIAGR